MAMGEDEVANGKEEFQKFLSQTGDAGAYMKIFETIFVSGYVAGIKRGLTWTNNLTLARDVEKKDAPPIS